jgi:hypothetical protein
MPMMFFYFLKIIFDISTSKRSKKYKPHSILTKKKKFKFGGNAGTNAVPNVPYIFGSGKSLYLVTLKKLTLPIKFYLKIDCVTVDG